MGRQGHPHPGQAGGAGALTVEIDVKLFATFRNDRFSRQKVDLPDGSRVGDLLRALGIQPGEVAIQLVNGRESPIDRELGAGDVVSLFPAVGGG